MLWLRSLRSWQALLKRIFRMNCVADSPVVAVMRRYRFERLISIWRAKSSEEKFSLSILSSTTFVARFRNSSSADTGSPGDEDNCLSSRSLVWASFSSAILRSLLSSLSSSFVLMFLEMSHTMPPVRTAASRASNSLKTDFCHQRGRTVTFSMVSSLLYTPSLFAALRRRVYFPAGRFE